MSRFVSRRRALAVSLAPAVLAFVPRELRAQAVAVRCATTGSTVFAQPYLAQDLGYYSRAGLNVDVSQFAGGALTITAVLTGNADIGITTPTQLGSPFSHDLPVRMIGFSAMWDPSARSTGLYIARDSPLRDAKGLEGKTVAVNALNSTNFLGVAAWLSQNGADPAKVKTVEIPFAEIAAALKRGTIDAGVLTEPFIGAAKDDVRTLSPRVFDSLGLHYAVSVWFSRVDYIRANPALIKRLMDIAYESGKFVNAHRDQANPILAKVAKMPIETINAIPPVLFAEAPDPAGTRSMLDYAYRYKMFARPVKIEELMGP
jgi:NitT/TauT family transport system substrate-binding protein